MNIKKRYDIINRLMPSKIEELVLNAEPLIEFKGKKVYFTYDYYFQNHKETKVKIYNIETGTLSTKRLKKEENIKEEYDKDKSSLIYSHDKRYALYSYKYNLYLKNFKKNMDLQLTFDGSKENAYLEGSFKGAYQEYLGITKVANGVFSPDDKYAVINILKPKNIKELTITQVFSKEKYGKLHPIDYKYNDWFPFEDASLKHQIAILDMKTFKLHKFEEQNYSFLQMEYGIFFDENGFYYQEYNEYSNKKTLYYVNKDTYERNIVIEESTDTFFFDEPRTGYSKGMLSIGVFKLDKDNFLYLSSKDDLASIYIYNTKEGFKERLTPSDIRVDRIVDVDIKNNKIYFMATNIHIYSDPYYGGLCMCDLDGKNFRLLTLEDADHKIVFFDGYYTDTYSTIETVPVTKLKNVYNKDEVILVEANIKKLLKAGYIMPKRTKIMLDGGSFLYGLIILPKDYNENKKYPVIDYIYGGMQIINTPKAFSYHASISGREVFGGLEGFANLGFIGVIIDGSGTPYRGKKFHDLSYNNLEGCSGLKDHVEFIKKLSYLYNIDLNRVGIWGNSAGGYATTRALLLYPDFYKVGVASAGDHDNRMYNATWGLRFHGPYSDELYQKQDSAFLVDNLKGKLMLVHGLLDDNVHPSQTFRMIQYFNKANKDVDLCILPDTDHNCPANPYFLRRRYDYFVKNLLKQDPPKEYKFTEEYYEK